MATVSWFCTGHSQVGFILVAVEGEGEGTRENLESRGESAESGKAHLGATPG